MICGYCSREQNYRPEDCGICHSSLVKKAGSGFWEGGKGTRDKNRMSRKGLSVCSLRWSLWGKRDRGADGGEQQIRGSISGDRVVWRGRSRLVGRASLLRRKGFLPKEVKGEMGS